MKFADKLAKQRKANNLSQEQLADKIGVTRQSVSKWESGDSYPDMAKIIQLCQILNCNLNDLMDDGVLPDNVDVREAAQSKEEKVNSLKKWFDDFLNFVTRSVNMIFNMSFKARLKMLIELLIVGFILYLGIEFVHNLFCELLYALLNLLPASIYRITYNLLENIIYIGLSIVATIVIIHIYKIRYLDYYVTITDSSVKTQTVEEPIEENKSELVANKEKEPVVIIRDPKHSSSAFIDGIVSVVTFFFKLLLILFALPVIAVALCAIGCIAFCITKNGMVFISTSIIALGVALIGIVIVMFIYNVIFSRKQQHKIIIPIIIVGLILVGTGGGLFADNLTKLNFIESDVGLINKSETKTIELAKKDTICIESKNVEFVIDENKNDITIEFSYPEEFILDEYEHYYSEDGIEHYYQISNSLTTLNRVITDLEKNTLREDYDGSKMLKVKITCNSVNKDKVVKLDY